MAYSVTFERKNEEGLGAQQEAISKTDWVTYNKQDEENVWRVHTYVHIAYVWVYAHTIASRAQRTSGYINKKLVALVPPGKGAGSRKNLHCMPSVPFRSWTM